MKYRVKNPLPEKFSAAIRLAIKDMKALSHSTRYKIDMNSWHEVFTSDNKCRVCMAGAVLTRNFHVKRHEDVLTHDLFDTDSRLGAFNYLRSGMVSLALKSYIKPQNYLYPSLAAKLESDFDRMASKINNTNFEYYSTSPKKFYKWCNNVADVLEENGY